MIENTQVRTFNNITFTGYQRKVNENHVLKIVDYLKKNDLLYATAYWPFSVMESCTSNANPPTFGFKEACRLPYQRSF